MKTLPSLPAEPAVVPEFDMSEGVGPERPREAGNQSPGDGDGDQEAAAGGNDESPDDVLGYDIGELMTAALLGKEDEYIEKQTGEGLLSRQPAAKRRARLKAVEAQTKRKQKQKEAEAAKVSASTPMVVVPKVRKERGQCDLCGRNFRELAVIARGNIEDGDLRFAFWCAVCRDLWRGRWRTVEAAFEGVEGVNFG
jgi:hypothetical protein